MNTIATCLKEDAVKSKPFPHDAATAVEAIDDLLEYAAASRASDIHIDPRTEDILIRLRIDGCLDQIGVLPHRLHEEIIARLKILSGARTDLHAVPQDGRWRQEIGDESYNIRISFMLTYYGENAVIRLLPARAFGDISLARLGFTPGAAQLFDRALRRPHGLILATGPTGCGKTTTLRTCLSLKAREPLSVITLEDPVEYEIAGVRQVHINHNLGVSFAAGLRAALRQDPDVIMVGEIRDEETARVAVHTALTGHLVFSTLHTNSALETIPRLIDMGVDSYLLASTLRLVVSQRLVRNMCQQCMAIGCGDCRGTGYAGRSVIAEICEVDAGFSEMISRREPLSVIEDYAASRGFVPIVDDGMEKVEWGVTTREEVLRVIAT